MLSPRSSSVIGSGRFMHFVDCLSFMYPSRDPKKNPLKSGLVILGATSRTPCPFVSKDFGLKDVIKTGMRNEDSGIKIKIKNDKMKDAKMVRIHYRVFQRIITEKFSIVDKIYLQFPVVNLITYVAEYRTFKGSQTVMRHVLTETMLYASMEESNLNMNQKCQFCIDVLLRSHESDVSWIRNKDAHILTIDRYTFISDSRFVSWFDPDTETWTLQVKFTRPEDAGRYECQVSTEPKRSHFVTLSVVVPLVVIPGGAELHVRSGSDVIF
ncbi:hypothetical protein Anas_10137 [Armadillidium nasatum]|uniref:Ig-like domain-containing protein n=1 Tax=Armadillidium nasatum TaxID=96803 RepID=A0A5N5TGN5_9CRUS|nr:hypothetical protein Anas_10137 [Armadillidium nasatum]